MIYQFGRMIWRHLIIVFLTLTLITTSFTKKISITRFSTGFYVLIAWYDTSFNLIGTLGNLSNSLPLAPLNTAQINAVVLCD